MAKVPVYSPQVRQAGLPGARQTSSAPPVVQVGDFAAAQTQQMGQNITRAATQLGRIELEMQAEANQLRVDDAINKAKEAALRYTYDPERGYLNIKGESALNRQSGKPLSEEYNEQLDNELASIADNLGNDAQRNAFNQARNDLLSRFQGQVLQHESQEYRNYRSSVREGTIANRTNEIALAYNNPQVINENLASIKSAVWDLGRLNGWSAEEIEAQQRDATSAAHRTALAAALTNNDTAYADAYLRRYSQDMSAEDILRVQGLITKDLNAKAGVTAANDAIQQVLPQFMPTDMDRLANLELGDITEQPWFKTLDASKVGAESGGRRFADNGYGKRNDGTEKGSGFLGELKMQDGSDSVATEISIGVEIDGQETEIPTLVPTLTKSEIDHLIKGGDPTDAIVDKAVAHARERIGDGKSPFANDGKLLEGPNIPGQGTAKGEHQVMDATNSDPGYGVRPAQDNSPGERARVGREYLAAMIKEYKGSLPHALAAYNAGPGNVDKAVREAEKAGDEANWMNYLPKPQETIPYVNKVLGDFAAGKGRPPKPTLAQVQANVRAMVGNSNPERLAIALETAESQYKVVEADIKAREEHLVAQAMRELQTNGGKFANLPLQLRASIPPGEVGKLMDYAKKVNSVTTNPAVYQRLSNPNALNSLSEDQFFALRAELSESDWQMFAKQRAGNTADSEKLNTSAIDRALKTRLAEAGRDPSPDFDDDEGRQLGVIRSIIDKSILGQQQVLGKQMTDDEVEKHIDKLFSTSVELKNSWYQLGDNQQVRLFDMEASDVPDDAARAIKASFTARGIAEPSEYEILKVYIAGQLANEAN